MLQRLAVFVFAVLISTAASGQGVHRVLVPAAGSIPGNNGTFFRSDISITNLRNVPQVVFMHWLPQGRAGAEFSPVRLTLPSGSTISSEDFVTEILHESGLGAIDIVSVTDFSQEDGGGRLHVTSRIWSPQAGSAGTVSQSLPSLEYLRIFSERVAITGLRHGPRFRTNVGIVNLDNGPQTFRVHVSGKDVLPVVPVFFDVPVAPRSMQQVSVPWPDDSQIRVDVEVLPLAGGGRLTLWTAYAANVDNVTGDSWSFSGVNTTTR